MLAAIRRRREGARRPRLGGLDQKNKLAIMAAARSRHLLFTPWFHKYPADRPIARFSERPRVYHLILDACQGGNRESGAVSGGPREPNETSPGSTGRLEAPSCGPEAVRA